jgi:hypothetical protein
LQQAQPLSPQLASALQVQTPSAQQLQVSPQAQLGPHGQVMVSLLVSIIRLHAQDTLSRP